MGKLILARHHESEWNKLGKWTGTRDRHLTEHGFKKSEGMGLLIRDMNIDYAFASMQVRSIETLSCMLNVCERYTVPTEHCPELNERDYGVYTGKNKWDMEEMLGKEEFRKVRRSWDFIPPSGESLQQVYERVVPFYKNTVLPLIAQDKNVLIVAHGNSLRSLVKYIEQISDDDIANIEFPFGGLFIYDLDTSGRMTHKEVRSVEGNEKVVVPQIIATIGPASFDKAVFKNMVVQGVDVVRFNFSWSNNDERAGYIAMVREVEKEVGKKLIIIGDLPGSRVQGDGEHTYTPAELPTRHDRGLIQFGVRHAIDYFALSFVGSKEDVIHCKQAIQECGGTQKVIAKIERACAVDAIEEIINEADAIMIARGDLGNEVPLEQIPFVQEKIIELCKERGKTAIVATQMLFSMQDNPEPTRAEVEDVSDAIRQGADAVMLSEETAIGKHPVDTVTMMRKIVIETLLHVDEKEVNPL